MTLILAKFLYWKTPWIRARWIAKILDCAPSRIWTLVGPIGSGVYCDRCGAELLATSRSKLVELKKPSNMRWPEGFYRPCKSCRSEIMADRKHEYEKQETEEETYRQMLRSLPYQDYLQTDHWQTVRHQALKRAHYRCQVCNNQNKIEVHHRTYENRGHEQPSDLTVLCDNCHKYFHFEIERGLPISEIQR